MRAHARRQRGERPPFLVEEFIAGKTLRDRLGVGDRLSYEESIRIIGEICDALYYMHSKGLVHRDIKPSNIMLDPKGSVKVTDFGLIRIAGAPRVTQIGMCIGTPHYMSVEQARGDSASITRALEKDPARRFKDAHEMALAFGYARPFNRGETSAEQRSFGLRLQNLTSGGLLTVTKSPTLLLRSAINAKDQLMSREHGQVQWQDGFWRIAEQRGRPTHNGIYLNGVRVDEEADIIQSGDEIRLGNTLLRVI